MQITNENLVVIIGGHAKKGPAEIDEMKSTEKVSLNQAVHDQVLRFFKAEGRYRRTTQLLAKSPMGKSYSE